MKKSQYNIVFLLVFFAMITSVLCYSSSSEEAFLTANNFYEQKKYEDSLKLYSSIDKKGSAVWYNMGNCAFRMDNYIDAIVYWRRAELGASLKDFEDIENNILVAYEKLELTHERSFLDVIYKYISRVPIFLLQIVFLVFWFTFFIMYFFLKQFRRFALTIFMVLNVLIGFLLLIKYGSLNYKKVIVVKSSASLFTGPDENYHVICKVPIISEMLVKEKKGKWYKVNSNGQIGWVFSEYIEVI